MRWVVATIADRRKYPIALWSPQYQFTINQTSSVDIIEGALSPVPEPSSAAVFGLLGLGVVLARRRALEKV